MAAVHLGGIDGRARNGAGLAGTVELGVVNDQIQKLSQDPSPKPVLDSYARLEHLAAVLLDPWGPSELRVVRNHELQRVHKVYINTYHLFSPRSNSRLMCLGIGGAFHSAIELKGVEYAFGGHPDEFRGIYDTKPLWKLRAVEMAEIDKLNLQSKRERKKMEDDRLALKPPLMERRVLGTWAGTDGEWEGVLETLHKRNWKGPRYRLLSRNCNDFVSSLVAHLANHASFSMAPGFSEKSIAYLFQLPKSVRRLCCCLPIIPDSLDEPMAPLPMEHDIFKGRARCLGDVMPHFGEPNQERTRCTTRAPGSPFPSPLQSAEDPYNRAANPHPTETAVQLRISRASASHQSPSHGNESASGSNVLEKVMNDGTEDDNLYGIHAGALRLSQARI